MEKRKLMAGGGANSTLMKHMIKIFLSNVETFWCHTTSARWHWLAYSLDKWCATLFDGHVSGVMSRKVELKKQRPNTRRVVTESESLR